MEKNYAMIKDNIVINITVIDSPDEKLLEHFIKEFNLDYLVEADTTTEIGYTYDGKIFWSPKPFESWIKGETEWVAPLPIPSTDKAYEWDEQSLYWTEIAKPYDSWILVDNKWVAPIPEPKDGKIYFWDEAKLKWTEVFISFK